MRKISLISIAMLIVSIPTFAGGLLTNTNQHPAFLRMLSRGANTTGVDAALSNPAGLAFLPKDGFYTEQIIKAEITENPDKYDIASSFNKLQLSYLKIRSDSEQGKYSYVPAWALSRLVDYSNEQNAIFVNAIDGTIINLENSL